MISAIIPAFNEEGCIIEFANRLETALKDLDEQFEIIFMVGGTDSTYALLVDWRKNRSNVWIIYEKERGLGTAIVKGFAYLHRMSEWVLTMDSDLQQLPEEIYKLWNRRAYSDVVIGSKGELDSRSFFKRVISKLLYRMYRYTHDIQVRDMGSNFRLYWRKVIKALPLKDAPPGYQFQQWSLLQIWKAGFGILEVPTTFNPRMTGKSKLSMWHELYERFIRKLSLSGLIRER